MYEIRQRLCARCSLVKICPLSAKGICRNDCLRLEAISANRTAELDLTESRHNASSISRKDTKGISVPVFLLSSITSTLVQHFMSAYFLASQARRALGNSRHPVVDAD